MGLFSFVMCYFCKCVNCFNKSITNYNSFTVHIKHKKHVCVLRLLIVKGHRHYYCKHYCMLWTMLEWGGKWREGEDGEIRVNKKVHL